MYIKLSFYNQSQNPLVSNSIFAVYLAINLLNGSFRYDAAFGAIIAIIECYKFKGGLILFTKDTYVDKENAFKLIGIDQMPGWIGLKNELVQ